jgi:hypothetical protein
VVLNIYEIRVLQAYSTLSNAKTRKQHDAYLQKLQDNQYEKFMPSWHRWYFEDRNRSRKYQRQREDSSSSSSEEEEEDGKKKEKDENMDEEAQQEENAANEENSEEAKATPSSSREGGRKRIKRMKTCTCW